MFFEVRVLKIVFRLGGSWVEEYSFEKEVGVMGVFLFVDYFCRRVFGVCLSAILRFRIAFSFCFFLIVFL